jgi:hypothetical protein
MPAASDDAASVLVLVGTVLIAYEEKALGGNYVAMLLLSAI